MQFSIYTHSFHLCFLNHEINVILHVSKIGNIIYLLLRYLIFKRKVIYGNI